ncbi:hypothetical protein [Streptomyces sp. NBRC 110035]|uniref:hypothetical protein n=1 Tax=Streptomyces sp. NBRC 110035 TaxID=1547867 RepID=UPI00131BE839|nr:hypothetical protein [Streptomyces sp. NBRC 110035]
MVATRLDSEGTLSMANSFDVNPSTVNSFGTDPKTFAHDGRYGRAFGLFQLAYADRFEIDHLNPSDSGPR